MSNYERIYEKQYIINTEVDSESNKSKKVGRPKLPILTVEEMILEEYKKLEMSYNLLEIEYKILKTELEISLKENELMKLKDIRKSYAK